jgi:hypothetical protein
MRRERRFDGSERIFYAPGVVTLAALADFVERFPRERAKPPRAEAPATPPTIAHPAEAVSAGPLEEASMELIDHDPIKPSSCARRVASSRTATGEEQAEVSKEDNEVARRALAERMARKHPTRTSATAPPRPQTVTPAPMPPEVNAEFEQLFGRGWRRTTFRDHLQVLAPTSCNQRP